MKNKINLLIITTLIVFGGYSLKAQSKVAHINVQELVESMPEFISSRSELMELQKAYESDFQEMQVELQNKVKQYDTESKNPLKFAEGWDSNADLVSQNEAENAKRFQELQGIEQSIQQYLAQAQQDLAKKEAELTQPIIKKANEAISKVGNAQGFDYVLDSSEGRGVVKMANGKDLLADVKKELGY